MKFFVTGASGQLGSALVKRLLTDGHEVVAYLRHRSSDARLSGLSVTIGRGALLDVFGLKKWMKGCDGVFHVAGLISWREKDRDKLYRTNRDATRAVVTVARDLKIPRVVVTGSVMGVGLPNQATPVNETTTFNATGYGIHYAISKHEGQQAALALAQDGFGVVCVAPGIIIDGESRLAAAVKSGRLPAAFPGGIAFVGLDDAIKGHIAAFTHGRSGETYILGGENCSYRQAIDTMARHFGVPAPRRTASGAMLKLFAFWKETIAGRFSKTPPRLPYQLAKVVSGTHFYDSSKAAKAFNWKAAPLTHVLQLYYSSSSPSSSR